LIARTNLFPNDVTWTAGDGNPWTLESVAELEAMQDIAESPCGGMHRLMAWHIRFGSARIDRSLSKGVG
jgi:hypothetical protein